MGYSYKNWQITCISYFWKLKSHIVLMHIIISYKACNQSLFGALEFSWGNKVLKNMVFFRVWSGASPDPFFPGCHSRIRIQIRFKLLRIHIAVQHWYQEWTIQVRSGTRISCRWSVNLCSENIGDQDNPTLKLGRTQVVQGTWTTF